MLIAAKFEEIHPPEVRDFAYITDNTYSKLEILDMEAVILNALAFDLACPTAVHFLTKFQRANRSKRCKGICPNTSLSFPCSRSSFSSTSPPKLQLQLFS